MVLNSIHAMCHKVRVTVSQGPGDEQKQYNPKEYNERDLQTVRHSSNDGKMGQRGSGVVSSERTR